ncbi:hypothetical protein C8R44DRAFT_894197 [Mycena epipterygia]|nr:hypothetical protein C8R44DRAFT_894197 [Mycena epipterygia]
MFVSPGFVRQPEQLDTRISINNVMRSICDEIPMWHLMDVCLGRVHRRLPKSRIRTGVYVLQIGEMLSRKALPAELVNLLHSSQVIKAGRQVNGDLQRLAVATGYPPNYFRGALDLAAFAKDRFLITKATVSLADLFAVIFHQSLPKNDTERVSSNWSDQELSDSLGLNVVDGDDGVPDVDTEPSHEQDAASAAEGETISGPAVLHVYAWLIRSCVLKDVFHVFHMIYIAHARIARLGRQPMVAGLSADGQRSCGVPRPTVLISESGSKSLKLRSFDVSSISGISRFGRQPMVAGLSANRT